MKQKTQEGYYLAIGIGFGLIFDTTFGIMLKNIALGLPIGLAVSAIVGAYLELTQKKKNETNRKANNQH